MRFCLFSSCLTSYDNSLGNSNGIEDLVKELKKELEQIHEEELELRRFQGLASHNGGWDVRSHLERGVYGKKSPQEFDKELEELEEKKQEIIIKINVASKGSVDNGAGVGIS